MAHAQAHRAVNDMKSGARRSKVPAHWWDLVESQLATARYDQETPGIGEHTWRLVPKVAVVAKPKEAETHPVVTLAGGPYIHKVPTLPVPLARPKPTPVAPPPKATVAKAPTPKATPAKAATVAPAVATVTPKPTPTKPASPRQLDPRLPAVGAVQAFTAKDGTVYTWKVINDTGRVSLQWHNADDTETSEEFSSVSSAAAKINHGTSTNGYLFFGLGKKAMT